MTEDQKRSEAGKRADAWISTVLAHAPELLIGPFEATTKWDSNKQANVSNLDAIGARAKAVAEFRQQLVNALQPQL